jgi:hypothetical protein
VETLWNVEGKVREKIRIAKGINGSWVIGHGSLVIGAFRHFCRYSAPTISHPVQAREISVHPVCFGLLANFSIDIPLAFDSFFHHHPLKLGSAGG